jgi:hypothetical protein
LRYVFLDTEFTGEHQFATLVSIGLVGEGDEELYVTFNDYDRAQVTPWLRENVLDQIDAARSVDRAEGWRRISAWLDGYAKGERVALVSMGKLLDNLLLYQLWHAAHPELPFFHHLHYLPAYLNHAAHFDLATVFALAGLDPNLDREALVGHSVAGVRHDALHDAKVVRACFVKVVDKLNFPHAALPAK